MKPRFLEFAFTAIGAICLLLLWVYWSDIILWIARLQTEFHQVLSKHIGQFKNNPMVNGAYLMMVSFIYGVFHAAGPGHGKAVLITYLSTQKETLKQGVVISFAAAIFQAAVAIAIVTVVSILLNQTFSQANIVSMRTEQSSYVLVMLFGCYFFVTALLRLKRHIVALGETNDKHYPPNHHHAPASHCDHDHAYVPEMKTSKWQTMGIIATMGARPCTGAVMVLIYAKIIGIYWVGVVATMLMGLGTGVAIALLGFLTLFFRDKVSRLVARSSNTHTTGVAPILLSTLGGFLLVLFGWSLFQTSIAPAVQHPLF